MIENNICLMTDSYKITHHHFYPKGTEKLYSYMESRIGAEYNKTVFFGLQYILKKYLTGNIVTEDKIDEAERIINTHIGEGIFNREGWEYILHEYDGRLPITIKAVEEGTPVEVGNVLITVENTDKKSFWLVNYLEPLLLQVWYPSTVATLSAEIRKLCNFYLKLTSDDESRFNNLNFMLHDFGYRGASSNESSMLGGSAHLLSFKGTDTLNSFIIPMNYYNYQGMPGFSVQATEHSVMTSQGLYGEYTQAENVIKNAKNGVLSLVIDSYNYKMFLENASDSNHLLGHSIREFLNRNEENKIVFRPDSGEPVSTTIDCLNILKKGFKTTKNSKGYYVFEDNIGLLWGDGLNYQKIRDILFAMKSNHYSSDIIVFGMGGGLHTNVNRDTQRNAFKCSAQLRDGKWFDIFKNPLDSSKKSKTGRLKLIKNEGKFNTVNINDEGDDYLRTVFKDGYLIVDDDWNNIKSRCSYYIY